MENAALRPPKEWERLSPEDRAVFERVWRRVMPEERPDSPISVKKADGVAQGDVPCVLVCPLPGPAAAAGKRAEQAGAAAREKQIITDLQRKTLEALECRRMYQSLARRAGGEGGRLYALAAEEYRAARQLSTACFLRSAIRYWPAEGLPAPRPLPYPGALRRAYQREQQREQAFRRSATAGEEALAELYAQLAGQCARHSRTLWDILARSGG